MVTALVGLGAIKGAVEEHKKTMSQGGFVRRLIVEDGETAQVILLGTPQTEPVIIRRHTLRDGKTFDTITCREEKCVACYRNTTGDKRIGKAGPKVCFSFYDLRWAKKVRDAERSSRDGQDRFKYEPIAESQVSEKGKARGIHVRRGRCGWEMSPQWAQSIVAHNAEQGKRCKSCLRGKIECVGYVNTKTKEVVPRGKYGEETIQRLLSSGKIKEKLKCSACPKPVRRSIWNSVVAVTRTGKDTSTTYQFQILAEEEIPEDVKEAIAEKDFPGAYDWVNVLGPLEPEAMAAKLKVKNPFGSSKAASGDDEADDYDDDEDSSDSDEEDEDDDYSDPFKDDEEDIDDDSDEEDEEGEEEDDEDERPVKKKVVTKKVVKKTPVKKTITKTPTKKVVKKKNVFLRGRG